MRCDEADIIAASRALAWADWSRSPASLAFTPARCRAGAPRRPVWTEVHWPFPDDEWGKGKAFRCTAADCGTEVNVYVRAKIGFCNCTTGVADDEELDRAPDFKLIGDRPSVLAPVALSALHG